ncbi:MAG TPA: type IV pilus assembly protein PilM [Patescibacteria group bacterium]|nr:type IV pilus assembly protein PilM [Patescibacteria group bacterium]
MINHFGLDIGAESIKAVQVVKGKEYFQLVTAGLIKTPVNGMTSDAEKDLVAVAEAIKKLKSEIRVTGSEAVLSLPERSVFTQIIEVPKMTEEELKQAIPWEAENLIPQPIAEVNLDWEVIPDEVDAKNNKMRVLLAAAPTALINKYLKVLKLAELEPKALETELLAIVRCLKPFFGQGSLILANLGGKSSDIAVIHRGNLYLTRQLPTAGEAITRALTTTLNMDFATAEEYKKTYGLSGQFEDKLVTAIEPILGVVTGEVKKAAQFYLEKEQVPLKLMILTGGTSLLPGITEYFTRSLDLEVQVADPFSVVKMDEKSKQFLRKHSSTFAVALGLAMKED